MNTLYLLILLFLVWFSLANNMLSFGITVSILVILLALVGGIGKRSKEVTPLVKAPAVKQKDIIYVPVVEDTEAPYLYPPNMKIQIRPDVWGMNQFEEPAHAVGQGMQGIIRLFKKWTRR
jgi:hypothetical protein